MTSERLQNAIRIATGAAAITREWFIRADYKMEGKEDGSPVTQADREAELFVRAAISSSFPGDGVVGEEFDDTESSTGYSWVVDPIDGTISFVRGVPLFGTMLACLKDGEPILGVITMPMLGETVAAEIGGGCAWLRDGRETTAARVSTQATLDESIVLTTGLEYYRTHEHRAGWSRILETGCRDRGWSDCYGFVLVATGRAEAAVEPGVNLWDIAAVPPIISEAGGAWTDVEGGQDLNAGSIIASNGLVHQPLVRAMCGVSLP